MKKLMLFLIVGIFMFSFVNALDFDNVKTIKDTTFDKKQVQGNNLLEKYKPIQIKNSFGLGKTLFEGYIDKHTETCSNDCSSTIKIKTGEDGVLIEDVKFLTLQDDGSWIEQDVRSYQFSYLNNNNWTEYDLGDELPAGEYEIKLNAEKKSSRTVDWIIKTNGEWLESWAVWGGLFSGTEYQLNILADSVTGATGTIIITELQTGVYKINTTTTNDEVSRAEIMEWLFYGTNGADPRATSTYITNPTAVYSNDLRDDDKRGIYATVTKSTSVQGNYDCNFTNTVNNIDISSWSNTPAGDSNPATWNLPLSTVLNSASNEIGTDTSADEKDNQPDCRLRTAQGVTGGSVSHLILLSNGSVDWIDGGSTTNPSNIDFYVNESFPIMEYSGAYVSLNSPIDNDISTTEEIEFNASAEVTGGAYIKNISLWTNKDNWELKHFYNYTNGIVAQNLDEVSLINSQPYTLMKTIIFSDTTLSNVTNQMRSGGVTSVDMRVIFYYEDGTSVSKSHSQSGSTYVDKISLNDYPNKYVNKIEIWLDSSSDHQAYERNTIINGLTFSNLTYTPISPISSTTIWNVQACDSDGDCGFATSNYTVSLDANVPQIEIETPTGTLNYVAIGQVQTLNVTFTDINLDSCWYNYNGTNISIPGCLTGVKNSTSFILENNNYNITIYANDTAGNLNSTYKSWNYNILENSRTHNTTTYETARETYSTNITANSSLTAVSLLYNGTEYSATQSGTVWTYSRDIPTTVLGNNSIIWKYTYGGSTINSNYISYQNVSSINLTYCQSGTPHINFTFKDEDDDSIINATIATSTFNYYLGNGDTYKTLSYINNTLNYNYAFCFTPISKNISLDYRMQYESTNYPQRISEPETFTISNVTTNKILYLLNTVDGIYVTFQVINTADQLISGVDVTATREINGNDVVVATGTTSAAGSVTFWLNPDFTHDFSFSKTGYTTYEYSDTPTQASYTITLGGSTADTDSSMRGIKYSIIPLDTYLINDTEYTFGFNLTSSYWDVSEYGFVLRLSNRTEIDGGSTGTEGTELTLDYNVGNQTIIYIDYYWIINETTTTATKYWVITNSENTGWSIANFFTDLTIYLDSGIFGLDNFGRYLITFLIIFISIGVMSYMYGFTSPMAITTLTFGVIFFLDVVAGLIPTIRGIPYLLTFISALILVLSIFNEVRIR